MSKQVITDINIVAKFLANAHINGFDALVDTADCIVLCGSAILHCAETVFQALLANPRLAKNLIICGGIGHSTQFLYDAVDKHPVFRSLQYKKDQAESVVLHEIWQQFYASKMTHGGAANECIVRIESQSTNCGANAIETKKLLDSLNIVPDNIIIVQDPTMSLRTLASFQKTYSTLLDQPELVSFPTFIPQISESGEQLKYNIRGVDADGLWSIDRFLDLILGEIPRLRDDVNGYGPVGKGFIAHVDIPTRVLEAHARLLLHYKKERATSMSKAPANEAIFLEDESSEIAAEALRQDPVVEVIDDDIVGDITDLNEEDVYVIDKIVSHKTVRGKYEYCVRWEGYGPDDDTWEPHDTLAETASTAIDTYWAPFGGYEKNQPYTSISKKRKQAAKTTQEQTPTKKAKNNTEPSARKGVLDETADELAFTQALNRSPGHSSPAQIRPNISSTRKIDPLEHIDQAVSATKRTRDAPSSPLAIYGENGLARLSNVQTDSPNSTILNSPEKKWMPPVELLSWEGRAKIAGFIKAPGKWEAPFVQLDWPDVKEQSMHTLSVIYKKMPVAMLKYYESHLVYLE